MVKIVKIIKFKSKLREQLGEDRKLALELDRMI
jgi:hypothetical protein